ncbi:MAG: septum formation protein Maf [Caldilineaceae bacterium]|nr:septum formation protein Maf [Caldilineaceae bacterium]
MHSKPVLILASASQRRQQFFCDLGLAYTVVVADIDETPLLNESPLEMTVRLAEAKARAVAARLPANEHDYVIVASDTTVALEQRILGKPEDEADATRMLQELRARDHIVVSAVAVFSTADGRVRSRTNITTVQMRDYSDAEIAAYVASGDPLDKAGAYGIQARDFAPVAALHGCYASVMGLPLADLVDLLATAGVTPAVPADQVCLRHSTFGCCSLGPR